MKAFSGAIITIIISIALAGCGPEKQELSEENQSKETVVEEMKQVLVKDTTLKSPSQGIEELLIDAEEDLLLIQNAVQNATPSDGPFPSIGHNLVFNIEGKQGQSHTLYFWLNTSAQRFSKSEDGEETYIISESDSANLRLLLETNGILSVTH